MGTVQSESPVVERNWADVQNAEPRDRRLRSITARTSIFAMCSGVVAGLVSFLGSWNPAFWGDEAASVMSAERPLATLWAELGHIDAVHGTYYLFLHFWINAFGPSEVSVRLPSALAVGAAAAGIYLLGEHLFSRPIGVTAAVIFAILPRVTLMGSEGRSYAIGTAIGVWLTVLFVSLVRRHEVRLWPWVLYGLLLALSMYVFLYFALIAVVHGTTVLVTSANRRSLRRWLHGTAIAILVALPILIVGASQHGQIQFLAHRVAATLPTIFVGQWFENVPLAFLGWSILAASIALAIWRRSGPMVLVLLWAFIPMVVLVTIDRLGFPAYTSRYISMSTPAVALATAFAVSTSAAALSERLIRLRLRPRADIVTSLIGAIAVLAIAVLAVPSYLHQRSQFGKDGGSDLRQTAAYVSTHARPGDAIVFDQQIRNSRKPRMGTHLYPSAFVGLSDPTLVTPYFEVSGIWDAVSPVSEVASNFATDTKVWALELTPPKQNSDLIQLQHLGYEIVSTHQVHRTVVYELVKETP